MDRPNPSTTEPNALMLLLKWAEVRRTQQVHALGYEDDDEESKAFFENLPLVKSSNEQVVRWHLGRHSKRRLQEAPYGVDEKGRLRLRGRLVSDGGDTGKVY